MKDYSLYDVLVPNSIKLIKKHAFHMCYNLKRIDLNNVISIGDFAFNKCASFENTTIEEVNTKLLETLDQYISFVRTVK